MDLPAAASLPFISIPMILDVEYLFQHMLKVQVPPTVEVCCSNVGILLQQTKVQTASVLLHRIFCQLSFRHMPVKIAPLHIRRTGSGEEVGVCIPDYGLQFAAFVLPKRSRSAYVGCLSGDHLRKMAVVPQDHLPEGLYADHFARTFVRAPQHLLAEKACWRIWVFRAQNRNLGWRANRSSRKRMRWQ